MLKQHLGKYLRLLNRTQLTEITLLEENIEKTESILDGVDFSLLTISEQRTVVGKLDYGSQCFLYLYHYKIDTDITNIDNREEIQRYYDYFEEIETFNNDIYYRSSKFDRSIYQIIEYDNEYSDRGLIREYFHKKYIPVHHIEDQDILIEIATFVESNIYTFDLESYIIFFDTIFNISDEDELKLMKNYFIIKYGIVINNCRIDCKDDYKYIDLLLSGPISISLQFYSNFVNGYIYEDIKIENTNDERFYKSLLLKGKKIDPRQIDELFDNYFVKDIENLVIDISINGGIESYIYLMDKDLIDKDQNKYDLLIYLTAPHLDTTQ